MMNQKTERASAANDPKLSAHSDARISKTFMLQPSFSSMNTLSTNKYMNTLLRISTITFLLIAFASRCLAEFTIYDVSKAEAKKMGVTIRTEKNGDAGVRVWLEFNTQGKVKEFNRVELRMTVGGKHLVSAPLLASRPTADSVSAYFSADPSYLATSELWIVVDEPPLGGIVYLLKVKNFIEPEKSR